MTAHGYKSTSYSISDTDKDVFALNLVRIRAEVTCHCGWVRSSFLDAARNLLRGPDARDVEELVRLTMRNALDMMIEDHFQYVNDLYEATREVTNDSDSDRHAH